MALPLFYFMKSEQLPTLRKWGTTILARKRAIFIIFLILGAHCAIRAYLKDYYAVILPCDQPCQDGMNCDPLELNFEITPTQIKLSQPSMLWYRARITNRTCRRISPVSVDGFLESTELSENGSALWVAVKDSAGREIERLPIGRPDGGISWDYGINKGVDASTTGAIYPYQPNSEVITSLREAGRLKDSGFVRLNPGESFETVTPVLRPYRILATSSRTEDGGIADGYRRVLVENPPEFPQPPAGFMLLDRYKFTRPGRYFITAGFKARVNLYPVYKRWENSSHWPDLIFWGTYPSSLGSKALEVNLVSPPAVIEVVR